jgi:hypothetical protein
MSRALAAFSRKTDEIKWQKDQIESLAKVKMARAINVLREVEAELAPIFEIRPDINRHEPCPAKVIAGVAVFDVMIPWRQGELRVRASSGTDNSTDPVSATWLEVELLRTNNSSVVEDRYKARFDTAHPDDAAEFIGEWLATLIENPTAKFPSSEKPARNKLRGKKRGGQRA